MGPNGESARCFRERSRKRELHMSSTLTKFAGALAVGGAMIAGAGTATAGGYGYVGGGYVAPTVRYHNVIRYHQTPVTSWHTVRTVRHVPVISYRSVVHYHQAPVTTWHTVRSVAPHPMISYAPVVYPIVYASDWCY
jgi:hypothetical protein